MGTRLTVDQETGVQFPVGPPIYVAWGEEDPSLGSVRHILGVYSRLEYAEDAAKKAKGYQYCATGVEKHKIQGYLDFLS